VIALAAVAAVLVLSATRVRVALSWRHGTALAAVLGAAVSGGAGAHTVLLAAAAVVVVTVAAAAGALALVLLLSRCTVPACLRGGAS
jgi:hypothetical protein